MGSRDLLSSGTTRQGDNSILMNHTIRIGKNYINTGREKTVKIKCETFTFDPKFLEDFPIYCSHSRKIE